MISKISSSLSSFVGLKQSPASGGTSSFGGKKLMTFLLGTLDRHSALTILRGKGDILRLIWIYACSEWWALHLEEYLIPEIQDPREYDYDNNQAELINRDDPHSIPDLRNHRMFSRKKYFDCPLAVLQTGVRFPPLGSMPQDALAPINVNMMPFDLFEPQQTLPVYLHGYLPMIEHCRSYVKSYIDLLYHKQEKNHKPGYREEPRIRLDHTDIKNRIAYITIDERPLQQAGSSHRRGGVHVECLGALRMKEIADKSKYTSDLSWYHHWGLGSAIDEFLVGGIFVASNVSNSTAVWNCRVHDTFGDIIGPHGSLERMRDVLGPPTKKLDAGELIWLSDRTPHESLPIEDPSVRRQFFRLVVGEIAFWFADHNTPNPTGFQVPKFVPIIQGNKFDLVRNIIPIVWEYGSAEEISVAKEETGFRKALYKRGIGFLADDLLKVGIYNKQTLLKNFTKAKNIVDSLDPHYYSSYTRYFVQVGLEQMRYSNY